MKEKVSIAGIVIAGVFVRIISLFTPIIGILIVRLIIHSNYSINNLEAAYRANISWLILVTQDCQKREKFQPLDQNIWQIYK